MVKPRHIINELGFLYKSIFVKIIVIITAIFQVIGLRALDNSNSISLQGIRKTSYTMALGSAKYGAAAGALLFAVLTFYVLSRDDRKNSKSLIETSQNYIHIIISRVIALIILGAGAVIIGEIGVVFFHKLIFHIDYNASIYLFSHGVVMFPAILFSILICSGFYMLTASMDISFLVFGLMFFISIYSSNYLLNWVQTGTTVFSDFGGIEPIAQLIIYNRILWFFLSISIFTLGLTLLRKYQAGIFESLSINIKKILLPIICIISLTASLLLYTYQPYVYENDSALSNDVNIIENIKLNKVIPNVTFSPSNSSMSANVEYEFDNYQCKKEVQFITNTGLKIESVTVNNTESDFEYIKGTDIVKVRIPEEKVIHIKFSYKGGIKYPGSNSFAGYISDKNIYLLENSHWIFEPLVDTEDFIEVAGSITAPENLTVVPIGKLTSIEKRDGFKTWKYSAKCPGINIGVFASEYKQQTILAGGTSIEFYYAPQHENYIKKTDITGQIKKILNYYEQNIGQYPFKDMPLKIVESTIYKTGGHSTSNIVTISEYMFNRNKAGENPKDGFTFSHDIQIIAHEIAHQWWGGGINLKEKNEWSSEGLAEYYSYKYVQNNFPAYISEYILSGWEFAAKQQEYSYFINNPEKMGILQENLRKKIEVYANKTLAYDVMPLELLNMENIKGEKAFIKNISQIYKSNLFKTLDYDTFLLNIGLSKEEVKIE